MSQIIKLLVKNYLDEMTEREEQWIRL